MEGRQAPILSLRPEKIRRGTDRQSRRKSIGMRPNFRAAGIPANRKVAVKSDLHPGICGIARSIGQLPIGEELQPFVETDEIGIFFGKAPDRRRPMIAERLRPLTEPAAPVFAQFLRSRFEDRVQAQVLALLATKVL